MSMDVDRSYDYCQQVAKDQAKNFYYAFRTLPAKKRRAIYAVYAYCRLCDDIADDEAPVERKREMFGQVRQMLDLCLRRDSSDEIPDSLAPEFVALRGVLSDFNIPHSYFSEILEGVETDLVKTRFADFDELRDYCYKVASVVGLVCIEVLGYSDPKAVRFAVDMGIALQLTNIIRDVREDTDRDRVYIPQDEMARFGYTEDDLKASVADERFRMLMQFQADRARSYYESSRGLFELIDVESRACPQVLHAAYWAILNRIESSSFDVFNQRIGLSTPTKLLITARLWLGSVAPRIPILGRLL